ncbi:MAG: Crp/Fnr family transcriptional regulator [Arenicellales bacterium]
MASLPTFGVMMVRTQTLIQRLRDVPLFGGLAADPVGRLAESMAYRRLHARQTLYQQDDPAHACYVVLTGTMQLSVKLGPQRVIAGLAYPNDLLGLESLRSGSTRPETAVAGSRVELLEIDADRMRGFLLEHPRLQLQLLNHVISKLREEVTHAVQTGHYDAEQKIAAYLISRENGSASKAGETKSLSQAELADYLSLTPETFCRKVSKFRQLGWIDGRGNDYTVREHEALQRLLER